MLMNDAVLANDEVLECVRRVNGAEAGGGAGSCTCGSRDTIGSPRATVYLFLGVGLTLVCLFPPPPRGDPDEEEGNFGSGGSVRVAGS